MHRVGLLLLGLAACAPPAAGDTATTGPGVTDMAPPTATTADDPTGTTDACVASGDCETEGICVADYEAADPPPGGKRGAATCAPDTACIGALDLGRWCFDHRGCCDDLRCRPTDGVCEPATLGQTTGGPATTTGDTEDPSTGDTEDPSTGDTEDLSTGDTTGGTSTTGDTAGDTSTTG